MFTDYSSGDEVLRNRGKLFLKWLTSLLSTAPTLMVADLGVSIIIYHWNGLGFMLLLKTELI